MALVGSGWLQSSVLEMKSDGASNGSGRDVVRSAEGRKEVIKGHCVRQIDDFQAGAPLETVAVKEVVMSDGDIKQMT